MSKLFLLLIISSFMILFISCTTQPQKNLKVLIVTGGHDFEKTEFFAMFESFPAITHAEVVHPKANQMYASPEIDAYDAIVFYDMVQEITEDQQRAFINLLNKGKGMVFLHHSLVSYQHWDEFEKIIGGRYYLEAKGDVDASTYKHDVNIPVKITDPEHPVTNGLTDFDIHDEVYNQYSVLPSSHALISTTHPESEEIIGWANKYGKSKIVYIQLGHDHYAFENDNYRKLLKQAINWVSEN